MHLGILQCDHVRDELRPEFGDYPDMFQQLLSREDPTLTFHVYDLTAEVFPRTADECDAWLFTGSKWSVYDDDPWIRHAEAFAADLHAQRRPTVGICFGHQLIAQALGGRVRKATDVGWGVGVHTANILDSRAWMYPSVERLALVVSHQDQVVELPREAVRLAGHGFCPNDIYQIGDHIIGFQGHPEFPKAYSRATMERRRAIIGEDTYRAGVESLSQPIDETVAAAWILRFLAGAA
ncbi:glutamine amidotransferase-related protein [Arhodomonas sp. AD133]|uniref:glutamine amidotransferase-related protein n=1 Tax=Arhodomonas sp. AD133 TaxID=3415009 RepID=UPI003EBDD1A7